MTRADLPPGYRREQQLAERLEEVLAAGDELQAVLPYVNDVALRTHIEALSNGVTAVAVMHRRSDGCGPGIADDLAALLSAARTLYVPAQDAELGRTPTLRNLRAAKGLIILAVDEALGAAQAVGLTPSKTQLPWELPTDVSRLGNEGLLQSVAKRLDDVVERLDALAATKNSSTSFKQQSRLLEFYVCAMKVEIDLAKMHLVISQRKLDFKALARSVEMMAELTGDFVSTIRAWIGRITPTVSDIAEEVRTRVRRVVIGTKTAARWIGRKVRRQRYSSAVEPSPPQYSDTASQQNWSRALETTVRRALGLANAHRHKYATVEHLLMALTEDQDALAVLKACTVEVERLRASLMDFLDHELSGLAVEGTVDTKPTAGFQRVIQRAAIHVQSSGRQEVTGANVLVALFSERESHAVFFLQEQNMSRLDAVNYIAHGIAKKSSPPRASLPVEPSPPQDTDTAPGNWFSRTLETTVRRALGLANARRHEYANLEHLLMALTEDEDAVAVLKACTVEVERLRASLMDFLDHELSGLAVEGTVDATPSAGFQRVFQRAAIHVRSSGRQEITGANVLVSLFSERESPAVMLLRDQGMTRLDAVNYIVHGIAKKID